ncbi:MAG: hypothetical protein C0625_15445 [Arcobacter sp.]|nr:MAG: hypothetical protein C0625_15445 [Arcobacter sp.]
MEWFWEAGEHLSKLQNAIKKNDIEKIREHSTDLALCAEKAYTTYGMPNICLHCKGKGIGIFDVPYLATCPHCNGLGYEDPGDIKEEHF